MVERPVVFHADGLRLAGDLYLPDGLTRPVPGLVVLDGYPGLRANVPRRWGGPLVARGFAVLGFDYRGIDGSEGLRGRLWPQERVEDVRAAVSFLEQTPEVDAARIALAGWALGGSVAIVEAADDERVRAVAALQPMADAGRVIRLLHSDASWRALGEALAEDRRERARTGSSALAGLFEVMPLEPSTDAIVRERYLADPDFSTTVSLESAEAVLRFRPEDVVHRLAPRPLLLVHGAENAQLRPEQSLRLYERAGEPKELLLLEGKGHLGWAEGQDPATFEPVLDRVADLCARAFAGPHTTGK